MGTFRERLVYADEVSRHLTPEELRRTVDPGALGIRTTADCKPLEGVIGQPRAVSALKFGLGVHDAGFNIYVSGPNGIGKTSAIRSFLQSEARQKPSPHDWCYVNNFDDSYQPIAIRLPAGQARVFQQEIRSLIEHVRRELPKALESEEFANRRDGLLKDLEIGRAGALNELSARLEAMGFGMQVMPTGIMTLPVKHGRPLTEEEFARMTEEERAAFKARSEAVQHEVRATMKQVRDLERRTQEQLQQLSRQAAMTVVGGLIEDLIEKYSGQPAVVSYLEALQNDLLDNIELFKPATSAPEGIGALFAPWMQDLPLRKYAVNVLIDNSKLSGAPVIVESNPTYANLIGRIEKESQFGALHTDFTMIKAGALHRANGGYLVLRVEDLLREPYSWDGLKRCISAGQIAIEDLTDRLGFLSTKTLRPQPIPLNVKVILIGQPLHYQLLHAYDADFAELFKVRVDFDTRMSNEPDNVRDALSLLRTLCEREGYRHLTSAAAAKLVEHAARLAEDQSKLSTHFGTLLDIVREANLYAEQDGADYVEAHHLRKALDQRVYRSSMIQERLQEMILRNMLLIETSGEVVGQVNGLAMFNLGDYDFGLPSRITASVEPGSKGIIDIEREVELGGPIHSKGVMILSGYLSNRYGQNKPLSLSARIVFEQSYQAVEGDSASSAELYALLSALSCLPIKQSIAVTGSVNQHGEVQVIGSVNEKIEGFFDVCKARGLTGEQGVLIPAGNVQHLMLREDVVEAVARGEFHVWAVRDVDEGLAALTGRPASQVHMQVERRLKAFRHSLKRLASPSGGSRHERSTVAAPPTNG
jgi:lon-related putative ATP-dependent protease